MGDVLVPLRLQLFYDGALSPGVPGGAKLRLSLWTDAVVRSDPYVVVEFDTTEAAVAGTTVAVPSAAGAAILFMHLSMDCLADQVDPDIPAPVVPARSIARGECDMAQLGRSPLKVELLAPEFNMRNFGQVHLVRTDVRAVTGAPNRLAAITVVAATAVALMARARAVGRRIALASVPIAGIKPLAPGLRKLDTRFWNDKHTDTPCWLIARWTPSTPESPEFIEHAMMCTAARLGKSREAVADMASAALADVYGGAAPGSTKVGFMTMSQKQRDRPTDDTVRFYMLLAQTCMAIASTAHYLTDMVDGNRSSHPYRPDLLVPAEDFTSQKRQRDGVDCEDLAKENMECWAAMKRLAELANPSPLMAAVAAVARCVVPMMMLMQVTRPPDSDAQYDTGDQRNAHAAEMTMGTSALQAALKEVVTMPGARPLPALAADMLVPWKYGLPTLIQDGTMMRELYPRVYTASPERVTVKDLPPPVGAAARVGITRVVMPLNFDFYKVARNCYLSYGVCMGDAPVHELFFYSNVHEPTLNRFERAPEFHYGALLKDLYALPHVRYDPVTDSTSSLPPPTSPGVRVSVYPTYAPTAQELADLRPLVAAFHPLRPYPPPAPPLSAEERRAGHPTYRVFAEALARNTGAPPDPVPTPLPPGAHTVLVRYRDASRPVVMDKLLGKMFCRSRFMGLGTVCEGRAGLKVGGYVDEIIAGKPELVMVVWK